MSFALLPIEVVSNIICHLVQLDTWTFDAMQYRTVNHLFNEEILLACFVFEDPRQKWLRVDRSQMSSKLMAKRRLQGLLARRGSGDVDGIPWLASLIEAISTLDSLLSQTQGHDDKLCVHRENDTTSNPIFCNRANSIICESFVNYHADYDISHALGPFRGCPKILYCSADFWILAGACFGGGINLIRRAVEYVQQHYQPENWRKYLSSFLWVVIKDRDEDIIHYLLSMGLDVNVGGQDFIPPFESAAQAGRIEVLRMLLEPQHKLLITEDVYKYAISEAAKISDPSTRLDTVKFLITHGRHALGLEARSKVFYVACYHDDIVLAKLILDNGLVDIYDHKFIDHDLSSCSYPVALVVATERKSIACMRLILRNNFAPAEQYIKRSRHKTVWRMIYRSNSLELFKEILPHMNEDWCKRENIYLRASQIEGSFPIVEEIWGPFDVHLKETQITRKFPIGIEAIDLAIKSGRLNNVEFLLRKGVRTECETFLRREVYEENKDVYVKIEELLAKFQNPGLKVVNLQEEPPNEWWRYEAI